MKIYLPALALLFLFSCKTKNTIIGYWQSVDSNNVVELNYDSTTSRLDYYSPDSFAVEIIKAGIVQRRTSIAYKLSEDSRYISTVSENGRDTFRHEILKLDDSILVIKTWLRQIGRYKRIGK
jgi:uncharacterized lipoprotein YmbA